MLGGQLNFKRADGRAAELTEEYCGSLSQPVPVAAAASLSQPVPVAAAASAMAGAVTARSLLLQADDSRRSCKHAQLMVSTKLHTCAALFDHPSLPPCLQAHPAHTAKLRAAAAKR